MSRTVVNPQSSACLSIRTACAVRYGSPIASTFCIDTSLQYACMCASIRPGISVRPPTSMTRASLSVMGFGETSWISPSATRRYMPSAHSAFVPSKMRAFLNRSGVIRGPFL